jgi:hypothetical protein
MALRSPKGFTCREVLRGRSTAALKGGTMLIKGHGLVEEPCSNFQPPPREAGRSKAVMNPKTPCQACGFTLHDHLDRAALAEKARPYDSK